MSIVFTTVAEFYDGCAAMVERGILFKAHLDTLTIELSGGY